MIRIMLMRHDRAVVDLSCDSDDAAYQAIDAVLNDIHKGTHGTGTFSLYADRFSDAGLFLGVFMRQLEVQHPLPVTV